MEIEVKIVVDDKGMLSIHGSSQLLYNAEMFCNLMDAAKEMVCLNSSKEICFSKAIRRYIRENNWKNN